MDKSTAHLKLWEQVEREIKTSWTLNMFSHLGSELGDFTPIIDLFDLYLFVYSSYNLFIGRQRKPRNLVLRHSLNNQNISISRFPLGERRSCQNVEFYYITRNIFRFPRKVGNRNILKLNGSGVSIIRFPVSLYVSCYVRNEVWS